MTDLCVIPARGGSQRIPKKNIKHFFGSPIISASIKRAQESLRFERIVVSTDDEYTAKVARHYDAEVHERNDYYSQDEVGTQEVTQRVIKDLEYDGQFTCCLYATAPLLLPADLVVASRWLENDASVAYVMSVGAHPLRDAGGFYYGKTGAFREGVSLISQYTRFYVLPERRVCDINTLEDWERAEKMYKELWNA